MISLEAYEAELVRLGLSPHTRRAYLRTWTQLLGASALDQIPLEKVDPPTARRWWTGWASGQGSSGQLQMMAALKRGFSLLEGKNPFADLDLPRAEPAKTKIRYLDVSEVARLLGQLEKQKKDSFIAALVEVISFTLFHTGKRYGDLVAVHWTDLIRQGERPVSLRLVTKGGRHEDTPLSPEVGRKLAEFIEVVNATRSARLLRPGGMAFARSPYVFASRNGEPLQVQVYNTHLQASAKDVGISKVSSHIWRHSLATYLLNHQRRNLREVQEVLGHQRLETTARYTHVTTHAKREILDSICVPTIQP